MNKKIFESVLPISDEVGYTKSNTVTERRTNADLENNQWI